jgi:hypothetical protein
MQCNICAGHTDFVFQSTVLNKYAVDYYCCKQCGFLQTEHPHWLEEAYANAPGYLDTGMISRNIALTKQSAVLLFFLFDPKACYLDFAGGYGILTRMMRDIGFDFYWNDLYTPNLFAHGFEFIDNLKIELLTSFQSFEHFVDPRKEIDHLLSIADNILFTTELLPYPVPNPEKWWYYSLAGGQHVSFYSYETLKFIADTYNLNLLSNRRDVHLLTKYNISNTIFNALLKCNSLLFYYVRIRMTSKTMNDFNELATLNS